MTLSRRDKIFLERAAGLANVSSERHRHAAIITKKGKVISWGFNLRKNHPNICTEAKLESGVHAEVMAIKRSNTSLKGSTIYIARINKSGNPMFSKPCVNCQAAIDKAGITKIIYTGGDGVDKN